MARLNIPDEPTFQTYTVTAAQSVFPFDFAVFAKADLNVEVAGVGLDQSAFTLSGTLLENGGYQGGTITLNDAVANAEVSVYRAVVPARASQFAPSNTVPVGSVDQALNRLTANIQDIQRNVARAVKAGLGEAPPDPQDVIDAAGLISTRAAVDGANLTLANILALRSNLQIAYLTPESCGYVVGGSLASQEAAMTLWFSLLSASVGGMLLEHDYNFTTPKVCRGSYRQIKGSGRAISALVYKGAATASNILTFGGTRVPIMSGGVETGLTITPSTGLAFQDWNIRSDTQLLDGSHLVFVQDNYAGGYFLNVGIDEHSYQNATFNAWHGIGFSNTSGMSYRGGATGFMQGDGIRVSGQRWADTGADLLIDDMKVIGCAGAGLRSGGGMGGLETAALLLFGNVENAVIDTTIVPRYHREIFFGEHTHFDGGWINNIRVDDALSSGSSLELAGFMGSAGLDPSTGGLPRPEAMYTGDNIRIVNWNGGFNLTSKQAFNAKRNGVHINDADCVFNVGFGTLFKTNGQGGTGYDIFASVATTNISCDARFTGDAPSGKYNALTGIGGWVSQAVTLSSGSGSLVAYTAFQSWREISAGLYETLLTWNITDNGTGAGNMLVFGAMNAAQPYTLSGKGSTGATIPSFAFSLFDDGFPGVANIVTATGGYPGGVGKAFFTGTIRQAVS